MSDATLTTELGRVLVTGGAGFVGANLVQASITGFCPIARVFRRLGLRSGEAPARQAAWPDSDVPPPA